MLNCARRTVALCIVRSIVASNISCTKTVRVPVDSYDEAATEGRQRWLVTTSRGKVYAVVRFSITDSMLVIQELDPVAKPGQRVDPLPFVLRIEDVAFVERRDNTAWNTVTVGVIIFAAVAFVLFLWAWRNAFNEPT